MKEAAPPIIRVLTAILVVLTGVILYSLVAVWLGHDTLHYAATFIFASLGTLVVLILMGIATVFYRKHQTTGGRRY